MPDPLAPRPWQAPSARRLRRSGLFWVTLAMVAVGGVFAVRRALGPATVRYRLERIDRGPIRSEVMAPGTASAVATVPVGSPVSGTVTKVYADVNDVVERGQLLAQLNRGHATIRAPIAGVVVSRNVSVGQRVGPGRGALFTMTPDRSRIQVRTTVGEAEGRRVAVGDAVTLRGGACPDCVSTGTVSEVRLSPPGSGGAFGYTVLVEADNRDHKLRPGMTASVSIEVARRDGVLRLPLRAVRFTPPGMERTAPPPPQGRVFVLDHGRPRLVRVTLGLQDLLHVELVAGPLGEGDAVIVGLVGQEPAGVPDDAPPEGTLGHFGVRSGVTPAGRTGGTAGA
jgi:multidrug efflux pump subunit AcrA (membrane-fusion protein)